MSKASEMADRVAEVLNSSDYTAKVWAEGNYYRVYVKRSLSRREQGIGYVTIHDSGARSYKMLTRRHAGIQNLVEDALS